VTYNWEQYPGKERLEYGKSFSTHVRFSRTQIYISTRLLRQEPHRDKSGNERHFDLMVDKDKRVFALKFHDGGVFRLKTEPGQAGVSSFVNVFNPVVRRRIQVRYSEKEAAWIGSLDGKAVQG